MTIADQMAIIVSMPVGQTILFILALAIGAALVLDHRSSILLGHVRGVEDAIIAIRRDIGSLASVCLKMSGRPEAPHDPPAPWPQAPPPTEDERLAAERARMEAGHA